MSFFLSLSIFMIWPILSIYAYEYVGASKPMVGTITAAAFITAILVRVPFSLGVRTEHFSMALMGGLVANSAALAGYGLSHDIMTLVAFRVLHGVAVALDYTLMLTLSSMIASNEAEIMSFIESYSLALALGLVMGPAAGTLLVSVIDLRLMMFVASLVSLAAVAAGAGFLKSVHGIWLGFQASKVDLKDFLRVLRSRGVMTAFATYLSFTFAYGAFLAYAPLRAKLDLGLIDQHVTLLFSLYYFTVFLMRLFIGRLRRRFGVTSLLYLALGSSGIGMLMVGLAPHRVAFAVGFPLMGLTHGLIFPLTASVAARTTTPDIRITGNAAFLTSFDLGNLIGPLTASIMVEAVSISTTLAILSIVPFLGMLIIPTIRRIGVT